MALTTQTMTDEQRKSVALEYLKAFDNGGTTSTGAGWPGAPWATGAGSGLSSGRNRAPGPSWMVSV